MKYQTPFGAIEETEWGQKTATFTTSSSNIAIKCFEKFRIMNFA